MLVAAVTCVGFASCNNDEENPTNEESPIVGTWKLTTASGYTLIVFNSNGSGTATEYNGGNVGSTDSFTWILIDQKLTITYDNSGDTDIYEDVVVHDGRLYCTRNGETICLENYEEQGTNPDYSEASLVGTWKWSTAHGNGAPVIVIAVFNSDGSGTITEYDMGRTIIDNFVWHLDGNKLTTTFVYDDKESISETHDITFISNDILYWNLGEEADYWYRQTSGQSEVSIVGTWKCPCDHVYVLAEFKANGDVTIAEYDYDSSVSNVVIKGKWALTGDVLVINYDDPDDGYNVTYNIEITEYNLYWDFDGGDLKYWYRL